MIIGSIALVAVSAALWLIGLRENSDLWYYGSIVSSVLATFALLVGVRQWARAKMPEDDFDVDTQHRAADAVPVGPRPTGRAAVPRRPRLGPPTGSATPRPPTTGSAVAAEAVGGPAAAGVPVMDASSVDPPDEPPAEVITDRQARRIAALTSVVVVIDGRPRFHEVGCLHLLGREAERLPVAEAVELGFTPCSQCEPARGLLATSPRL